MAKAKAICTCKKCGKQFTREAVKRNRDEANSWEAWAVSNFDECGDCYAARKREEEKAAGLTCDIRLGSAIGKNVVCYAVFGGDSYAHKDELKAAGCRWTDDYPTGNALGDLLGVECPRNAWVLTATEPDQLIAKAQELGAKVTLPSKDALAMWSAFRAEHNKIEAERQNKAKAALEELGPIPAWPETIKAKWPTGATWNGTIYGRNGSKNIYLGGKKIMLTDDEAAEMEQVAVARKAWRAKKAEIENK